MSRMNPPTIEIWQMVNDDEGGSHPRSGATNAKKETDFWDVIVGYAGNDPLEESEYHPTYENAYIAALEIQGRYPGAEIEEINA